MNREPARLGKKQKPCIVLCGPYARIIVPFLLIILLILMLVLLATFIDMATAHNNTVVMLDSGNYYNHLKDVI